MSRQISRNASEIISLFTTAVQEQQLQNDKRELIKFKDAIEKKHKKYLGDKYKEAESLSKNIQNAEKFKSMEDHRMPLDKFTEMYETDKDRGLTEQEAAKRLKEEGENKLTERKGKHWSLVLLKEMANPFALLLWAGAILAFVAYGLTPDDPSNLYLGIVLIFVIVFVGLLTFYENMKSEAIMASFKDFIPPTTIVIRDGEEKSLDATKLVRGDLIKVMTGKKIPADIRIVWSQGMKVDNSSLTGETELLPRVVECTNPGNPLETKNVAFFSTMCREGSGKGIVMFTGDRTFIGQIATLASLATQQISPLAQEIDRFVKRLAIFAVLSGVIFFVAGFILKYPPITNFVFAVGIIVGNVPNGLLAEVTVALTLTAKKLSTRKVLCKTLEAVETLGSTSCICSDKTGTLTQNKMTATHLWYDGKIFEAANRQKNGPDYRYEYDINSPGFQALHNCAVVCSAATFDNTLPIQRSSKIQLNDKLNEHTKATKLAQEKAKWAEEFKTMLHLDKPTIGDASESALIKFFQAIEDILKTRERYPVKVGKDERECRVPFNSAYKYAYSINSVNRNPDQFAVFTKGAPEKIWDFCTHVLVNGQPVPKNEQWERLFKEANLGFGRNGQRVLGFAQLMLPPETYTRNFEYNLEAPNFPFKEQCFVGIVSLSDPPRDSVPYSVLKCQAAGIKVIMVTGDQPVTAASIARQCHIITEEKTVNQIAEERKISLEEAFPLSNAIVIHGDLLTHMALEDEGLPESEQGKKLHKWLSKKEIVFARTSPAQKLIIVKGCQKMDHIVAVTGDGVNDSPAIKKADIGIAMGITGTDVAKDAADMVLLNDDFSAIVIGVEEGRRIFDNLKKAICYVMTSQITEIAPFIGLIIFNYPVPVSPIILLYIDLGTDLIPAISYAYEEAELDLMTRKPRSKDEHLVTMKLMGQAYGNYGWCGFWGAMFNYFMVMNDFGFAPRDILGKNTVSVYKHAPNDLYNPSHPYFGNTLMEASPNKCITREQIDWLYTLTSHQDLRMSAFDCNDSSGKAVYTPNLVYSECKVYQISPYTNKPVCFTTEAAKYAQSAFFFGAVVTQYFNVFICKTRKLSLINHGIGNKMTFFGIASELMLVMVVAYFYPFNVAFGTRDCIYMHMGVMSIPFGLVNTIFDEFRRFLIRVLPPDSKGKPNFVERNTMW